MKIDRPTDFALGYLFGFRRIVVGAAIVLALTGWVTHIDWLLAVSVCVGIGELLESSYYIAVMRWGQRRGTLPPARSS